VSEKRSLCLGQRRTDLVVEHMADHAEYWRWREGPWAGKLKDGRHAPWDENSCLDQQWVECFAAAQVQLAEPKWKVVEWVMDPGDRTSVENDLQVHSQDAARGNPAGWLVVDTEDGRADQVHCHDDRVVRWEVRIDAPMAGGLLLEGMNDLAERMGEALSSGVVVQLEPEQ
jgi:hypothetical protein